ncbi:uncharacterized protein K452DRAFT_359738 [Aplosporella prunicola CBS 121167]|uniref:Dynamin-type G domain-containing protein n=1 Tax=Aplosporella prunicola CBS 121167 TaxID=1176127 RepID=A0A6A6BCV1_9PEZI|nr:uncharacterized protein K452DRAFT_359738 [Aplosporella prunicola CBS 121167]KAF2140717.1 hypothetical protein K452DRAFT_359738 [Aplosporella prunicola CBS 121167]
MENGNLNNSAASSGRGSSSRPRHSSESYLAGHTRPGSRPGYMTVGSGSTSESAARLAAMLDDDSGYGGSIADGSSMQSGWHPGLTEDRPTPAHTPVAPGETNPASENERRTLASHVHQLYYNQNKTALARCIGRTVDTLKKLQDKNVDWPAHYPQVQRQGPPAPTSGNQEPRSGIHHTQSTLDNHRGFEQEHPHRPSPLRRAGTSLGEESTLAESSSAATQRPAAEPRLVTPQLAQDFSVLKIDLKMGALSQTELVHSLEKGAIAQLLDGQINKSIKHLYSLRERIEDTSSKVLVTGDLNAGKSTFCNALLRRKILPEDQQPCTSIFCEVLDSRENGGIEEVHAVPIGSVYNRDNEATYDVYTIKQLEDIVTENDRYASCKVYIKDIRSVDESLLNNGVVDIALIDAPGLNADSLKTTAVFARQEEIDVVVFVVSAANHFTLSAKEFIFNAAREKAYMFMVVNGYDNIRDKNRCQEQILKQVGKMSPATFKESSELVHFVSSIAIPVAPLKIPGDAGGSGSSSGGPGGDPDGGDDNEDPSAKHGDKGSASDKGKGKEPEKIRDFEALESSLRRFVLEKRARSKLAPAKTYLTNVLGDLSSLATVNRDVAQAELDRVTRELAELEPAFEQSKKSRREASEDVDHTIEDSASEVYAHTRDTVNMSISRVADQDLGLEYPGVFSAFQYAEDIKIAMIQEISESVYACEDYAREQTTVGFNSVSRLGILHLGDNWSNLTFHPEKMFRKKRDALVRQVDFEVEAWDFFDVASLWERQEKVAGTSMAVTVAGVIGTRLLGGVSWVDGTIGAMRVIGLGNLRRMFIPGVVLALGLGVTYALTSIPKSLPKRLSAKLSEQLEALDYTHTNALRISTEVRKALKHPADELRVGLQRSVEKLHTQREKTTKFRQEADVARKYFSNLVRDASDIKHSVERVDLEGPAPGVAAVYDP